MRLEQCGQTPVLIGPEVVAYRPFIEQQSLCDLRYAPATSQQDDRLDSIGSAFLVRPTVGNTQAHDFFS